MAVEEGGKDANRRIEYRGLTLGFIGEGRAKSQPPTSIHAPIASYHRVPS